MMVEVKAFKARFCADSKKFGGDCAEIRMLAHACCVVWHKWRRKSVNYISDNHFVNLWHSWLTVAYDGLLVLITSRLSLNRG